MKKDSNLIFEKNFRTTWLQRIGKILCLFIPIGAAFGGYFLSSPLWKLIKRNEASDITTTAPEGFKFALSIILFLVITAIIFFKTRNTNPIMKIRVLTKNQEDKAVSQKN